MFPFAAAWFFKVMESTELFLHHLKTHGSSTKYEDSINKRWKKAKANPKHLSFYCASCQVPGFARKAESHIHTPRQYVNSFKTEVPLNSALLGRCGNGNFEKDSHHFYLGELLGNSFGVVGVSFSLNSLLKNHKSKRYVAVATAIAGHCSTCWTYASFDHPKTTLWARYCQYLILWTGKLRRQDITIPAPKHPASECKSRNSGLILETLPLTT